VLAALTASPAAALATLTLFGLLRGLAVLGSVRITSPAALHAFHRRFDAWGPASRQLAIVVQLGVAVIAGIAVGPVATVVVGLGVAVLTVVDVRTSRPAGQAPPSVDPRATASDPAPGPGEASAPAWRPTSSAAASAVGPTPPPP
jgi:hypothetical protein